MILFPDDIDEEQINKIGGKALNLLKLTRMGFAVPEWFVIPGDILDEFFKRNQNRIRKILECNLSIREKSKALKRLVKKDSNLRGKLEPLREKISAMAPVSIRSSGIMEDVEEYSFAGQFSSFLNVKNGFVEKILDCLASLFNTQNIHYHQAHDIDILKNRVAVIVQRMVEAEKSGVVFTAHPETGEPMMIVNVGYGLGEGVVSEKVDVDTFILSPEGKLVHRRIVKKKRMVVSKKEGGTKIVPVNKSKQDLPVLDEGELKEIFAVAKNVHRIYGYPQDIEFAIKDGKVFILQARPITTIKDSFTWDNSNIIESFSGPTTPLTFSFANEVYSIVYKLVMKNLGVSQKILDEHGMVFRNMIGFLSNRVYYSLDSWYTTLAFLPAYQANREFMEGMMGVKSSYDIREKPGFGGIRGIYEIVKVAVKILFSFVFHSRNMERFNRRYHSAMEFFRKNLEKKLSLKEYAGLYEQMKGKLLYHWLPPINNDIFTMIFYGLLKKYVNFLFPENGLSLHNQLLSGEGDMESALVGMKLSEIAERIRAYPELKDLLLKGNRKEFFYRIKENKEINELFDEFLSHYGNRSVNELKLEIPNIRERPEKLFSILKKMVEKEDISTIYTRGRDKRKLAEKQVLKMIYSRPFPFNLFHLLLFKFLLSHTRRFIKYRENQRLFRSNIFGAVRELFLNIAKEFVKQGVIDREDDIFFLSHQEIFSYIFGTSVTQDLKSLVRLRKREFRKNQYRELPERFTTVVPPYIHLPSGKEEEFPGELKGLGCSPGAVKGRVQIIKDPYSQEIKGDIMVAPQTDPGWLPIFPLFKGIIVERGSLLSHSAIVAREIGIPAVVGVRGVTRILKDGDMVEMDGSKGVIRKLGEKNG